MTEPLNVEKVLEVIGYGEDPRTVLTITFGVGYLELRRVDGEVRYYKTLHQPDGLIKLTDQDITWEMEWANMMEGGKQ